MKLIASGVANCAATTRSPSFSRFGASTTTTNRPCRMSSTASSTVANGVTSRRTLIRAILTPPTGEKGLDTPRLVEEPGCGHTPRPEYKRPESKRGGRRRHASAQPALRKPAGTARRDHPGRRSGARRRTSLECCSDLEGLHGECVAVRSAVRQRANIGLQRPDPQSRVPDRRVLVRLGRPAVEYLQRRPVGHSPPRRGHQRWLASDDAVQRATARADRGSVRQLHLRDCRWDASFAYLDDVQIARVGDDGNITADGWRRSPYHLHHARAAASSDVITIDGTPYLYVIGGAGSDASGNTIHFADVEYARINAADGSIGPWTLDPSQFAKPRSSMTTAFVQRCLYVVGGFGDALTDIFADTQYSCVHADGSLGPWHTSPNSMQQSRYGAEMVVVRNADGSARFIVLGGNHGGGTYLNEVEQTTVTGAGGNSPWTVAPSSSFLPDAQWGQTGVLFGGNVYVLGGVLRSQEYLNRTIYAPVDDLFPR